MDTTTPVTPSQTLAAYDQSRRKNAGSRGRPTLRMNGRVIPPLVAGRDAKVQDIAKIMCWTGPDDDKVRLRADGGPVHVVTRSLLIDTIESDFRLVLDDRSTLRRLNTLLNAGKRDVRSAMARRVLAFLSGLPASSRLVIMADVLAAARWAPILTDTRSFTSWAAAYQASDSPTDQLLGQLLDTLCDPGARGRMRSIARIEIGGVERARYGGLSNACNTFAAAEQVAGAWSAVCRLDPLLRDRCVITGEVATASRLTVKSETVNGVLSVPFKTRVGREVALSSGTDTATSTLLQLDVEGDELVGYFVMPSKRSPHRSWLVAAATAGDSLYVTDKPFDGAPGLGGKRRWADPDQARWEHTKRREVPLDVSMAGAS